MLDLFHNVFSFIKFDSWTRSSQSSPPIRPTHRAQILQLYCFATALDNNNLKSAFQGEPGPRGLVGPPGSRGNPVSDSILMFFSMSLSSKTIHHFVLIFIKPCLLDQVTSWFSPFTILIKLKKNHCIISIQSIKSRQAAHLLSNQKLL